MPGKEIVILNFGDATRNTVRKNVAALGFSC
jgi:hypothetical protein